MKYKMLGIDHLQDIDRGIAMSHVEITASETGMAGAWTVKAKAPKEKTLDYIISWQPES